MKLSINRNVTPRKWFLASTPQAAINDNLEQCDMQNFSNLNSEKIKPCSLIPKQIYSGDRFIPCRRHYDFEAANYLLKKESDTESTHIMDVFAQIGSLENRHRCEAFHAMMQKQALIPGLKQNKILHFNNSAIQSQSPSHLESKKERNWKCTPRKKTLIGSAEKILCMPDTSVSEDSINSDVIDWSCNDMITVGNQTGVTVYDDNGAALISWHENAPNVVKWSNDGSKLVVCIFMSSKLTLYDIEKKKILWDIMCKCIITRYKEYCTTHCICWSLHDRYIITACAGAISIYESHTGKLLRSRVEHLSYITQLSFSPNFNYLASIGADRTLRVFTWPEMIACFNRVSYRSIKTVAWHPQESGLLCIGGRKNGLLSLWNVKTNTKIGYMRTKFDASVENLVWNKLSGELVVHWSYKKEDERYIIAPVLASFNRIVDVLPLERNVQPSFMKFNATHEQLITYCNDVFSIWNFFGNEKPYRERYVTLYNSARQRQGVIVHNPIR